MEKLFPKFQSLENVRKSARSGAIGGLVFAGMSTIGIMFILFAGSIPGYDQGYADEEKIYGIIGIGIEIAIILLLTWRLSTGKGYVSATLLLLLFLLEIGTKIAGGGANVGWIIVYAAVALSLFNGIRACLAFKRVTSGNTSVEAF